jgi:hypothetical protein
MDQVLFTVRKCLIELNCLSSKTRAFLLMTLDLYYSNFTTLGEPLEKMYENFLLDETPKLTNNLVENNKIEKTEKTKARESLEKLTITKSPQKRQVVQSPVKTSRSPLPRFTPTPPPPASPQRNAIPLRSSPKVSPPNRAPNQNGHIVRKSSPQELRNRSFPQKFQPRQDTSSPSRKPPRTHFERSPRRGETSTNNHNNHQQHQQHRNERNRRSYPPQTQQQSHQQQRNYSTNTENILRQQNPENQPQSEPSTPVKYKSPVNNTSSNNNYRQENVENFSWASDGESDDLDNSTSPKINPYTSSFLNFLSGTK